MGIAQGQCSVKLVMITPIGHGGLQPRSATMTADFVEKHTHQRYSPSARTTPEQLRDLPTIAGQELKNHERRPRDEGLELAR